MSEEKEPKQLDGERPAPEQDHLVNLPALLSDEFGVSRSEARMHVALGSIEIDGQPVERKMDYKRSELLDKNIHVITEGRRYSLNYKG